MANFPSYADWRNERFGGEHAPKRPYVLVELQYVSEKLGLSIEEVKATHSPEQVEAICHSDAEARHD